MNQKHLFFTVLLMVSVIVSGCGPSAEQAATMTAAAWTATPTPTLTPTPLPHPKQGHWEGSNPGVSFDVKNDEIRNFEMEAAYSDEVSCVVRIDTLQLSQAGFTSEIYLLMSDLAISSPIAYEVINSLGPLSPVIKGPQGDRMKIYKVDGFLNSETTISGTYFIWSCLGGGKGYFRVVDEEETWNAKWVSP